MTGPRPVLAVSGLARDDDHRVLLVRRGPDGAYPGCWSLPGGKVEHGEALAEALRREIHEETALDVDVGDVLVVHESIAEGAHHVIVVHRIDATRGTARAGDDVMDVTWAAPDEIGRLPLTPGLERILGDHLDGP